MTDPLFLLPDHIDKAFDLKLVHSEPSAYLGIDKIVFVAMGGSGIVGNIVRDLIDDIPVFLSKDYTPPHFIDHKTLVICISYSGNTKETLEAFHHVLKKKCRLLGVTSGGKLGELLVEEGKAHILLPPGLLPRESLYYQLFAVLKFLSIIGLFPVERKNVVQFSRSILPLADKEAQKVAKTITGTLPFIYGRHESTCLRLKTQINEKAKYPASYALFPDMNHHEVSGWQGKAPPATSVIVLRDRDEREDIRASIDFFVQSIRSKTAVVEVLSEGKTTLEKILFFLAVGDLASTYTAALLGTDLAPAAYINTLKKIINE